MRVIAQATEKERDKKNTDSEIERKTWRQIMREVEKAWGWVEEGGTLYGSRSDPFSHPPKRKKRKR